MKKLEDSLKSTVLYGNVENDHSLNFNNYERIEQQHEKKTYNITFLKGCPFIHDGQGLFFVDFGTPTSVSKTKKINFAGEEHSCNTSFCTIRPEAIEGWFETEIVGIIGIDLIMKYVCMLDYRQGILEIGYDGPRGNECGGLAYHTVRPLFCINAFEIGGKSAAVILDSGAHISYLLPEYLPDTEPIKTITDATYGLEGVFHFESELRKLPCSISNHTWTMQVGNMPIQGQHGLNGTPWAGIMGKEFLDQFKVVIADKKIYLTVNKLQ